MFCVLIIIRFHVCKVLLATQDILLYVGKVFFYTFVENIFLTLVEVHLLLLPLLFFRFHPFIISQIFWMFCIKKLFDLILALATEAISTRVSSAPESLSNISCFLLVILFSVVPVCLPRFYISSLLPVCVFFIRFMLFFRSWTAFFTTLIAFSWFSWVSLRDL